MTYKPFIIAGMPRTGSNLLTTTIRQHPAILAYAELFHQIVTERSGTHAIRRDGAALYFDEASADSIEFLKRWVWTDGNSGCCAIGFKLFVEYVRAKSTSRLLERLRDEIAGLHVLHIRRTNYLDVYISRLIANKTERWVSYPDESPPAHKIADIRLVISPDAATRFFQAMQRADAHIEQLFQGERYLRVEYRNLSRDIQGQANAIFGFLGAKERQVVPETQKQVTAPKEDLVLNYEELRRHFAGSPYESFFGVDEIYPPPPGPPGDNVAASTHAWKPDADQGVDSLSLESLDESIFTAVNEGLMGLQAPRSEPLVYTFLPGDPEALLILPRLREAARGNLDKVNGVMAYEDLTLRRGAAILLEGWCCRTEEANGRADSRYFFLECTGEELRYYAHVPSRIQRDDVAAAAPELPDWATRFSGFDFLADLRHLQPGEYRFGVVHEAGGVRYEFVFPNRLTVIS